MELAIRFARFLAAINANFFPDMSDEINLLVFVPRVFNSGDTLLSLDLIEELVSIGHGEKDIDFTNLFKTQDTSLLFQVAEKLSVGLEDTMSFVLHLVCKYSLTRCLVSLMDDYFDTEFLVDNFALFKNAIRSSKNQITSKSCEEKMFDALFFVEYCKLGKLNKNASRFLEFLETIDMVCGEFTAISVFADFAMPGCDEEKEMLLSIQETEFGKHIVDTWRNKFRSHHVGDVSAPTVIPIPAVPVFPVARKFNISRPLPFPLALI
jgi:hypothetical protein